MHRDTQQMDGAEDSEMSESLHTKLELQEIRIRMLEDENALLRGEVLTHQVSSADHERAMDSVRAKRKLRNAVRFMMGAGMKARPALPRQPALDLAPRHVPAACTLNPKGQSRVALYRCGKSA